MAILSIDTCLNACSVGVLGGNTSKISLSEPLVKGHAERLAPLVKMALAQSEMSMANITKVGVTVGPGSFTGVRVGLAFARGLAIGQQLEVVPVTTLEALAASSADPLGSYIIVLIDARRGQVYGQIFKASYCNPLTAPFILTPEEAKKHIEKYVEGPATYIGSGIALVFPDFAEAARIEGTFPDPLVICKIVEGRVYAGDSPEALYLREADAKPAISPITIKQ